MSIDFTPGIINTYHGDIYNCTTNTDNVKTPQRLRPKCDDLQIYGVFTGKYLGRHQNAAGRRLSGPRQ